MIRYFKVNDPYRLLAVLFLLVVTRAVLFLVDNPFTLLLSESESMGRAINTGAFFPENTFTNAGPLFYYLYGLITYISTDTTVISVVVGAILVLVQAFLLNTIIIRSAALNDNTYLPAIIYAILFSSSPELLYLSPEMLAITFVLIGLNFLFTHLKYRGTEENIISTGFVFGLAALFARPAALLLVFILLVYLFYSNTLTRRYFLVTFGFFMPFIFAWLYFLWNDQGSAFWSEYFTDFVQIAPRRLIIGPMLLVWLSIPALLALISAAQNFTGVGMTNNQIQIQRSMVWMAVFGVILYLISANGSFSELIWVLPSLSYFISMFLISVQKPVIGEITFLVLLLAGLYFLLSPLLAPGISFLDMSSLAG